MIEIKKRTKTWVKTGKKLSKDVYNKVKINFKEKVSTLVTGKFETKK